MRRLTVTPAPNPTPCRPGYIYDTGRQACVPALGPHGGVMVDAPATVKTYNVNDYMWDVYGRAKPSYIGVVHVANQRAVDTTSALAAKATETITATRAQQATVNTAVDPSMAAQADIVAAVAGEPVVPVPPMYAAPGFVSANKARSSVQEYFRQPTFVSRVLPVSPDVQAVAVAAGLAAPRPI